MRVNTEVWEMVMGRWRQRKPDVWWLSVFDFALAYIKKVPAQRSHRSVFHVFSAGAGQKTGIDKRFGNADYVLRYDRRGGNHNFGAVLP